jgi:hypothetical protein
VVEGHWNLVNEGSKKSGDGGNIGWLQIAEASTSFKNAQIQIVDPDGWEHLR